MGGCSVGGGAAVDRLRGEGHPGCAQAPGGAGEVHLRRRGKALGHGGYLRDVHEGWRRERRSGHGRGRIGKFLKRLYLAAKEEDPSALITYANYPSTEYLRLPFLDLVCFNVYLESQRPFEEYLARLQTLAGERPLLITELGLDSRRNGLDRQAETLDWQIRTVFRSGCRG